MIKFLTILITCFLGTYTVTAQELTLSVSKNPVKVGEQFRVSYELNANGSNFKVPSFNGFDVLSGPNQSSSVQIINGNYSQSISYTFVLRAREEGELTIPAATITSNGKEITSNTVKLKVLKGSAPPAAHNQGNSVPNGAQAGDEIILRLLLNKSEVYQGEQITATLKLYSRFDNLNLSKVNIPEYNGFWTEVIDKDNIGWDPEMATINGMRYRQATIARHILFPQRSGKLKIESGEIECVVRKRVKPNSHDIFDQFFGRYQDVKYNAKSQTVEVEVLPLPSENKPESFYGSVGKFEMNASIDKEEVKANEAVNLKVEITGRGNIRLTDVPEINFPPDIEAYDPKVDSKISVKPGGASGKKTMEYVLIPRHAGEYNIGPIEFSYFDPNKRTYQTVSSPEFKINVTKGDQEEGTSAMITAPGKQNIRTIGTDIRFIKTGDPELSKKDKYFYASTSFFILLGSPALLFLLFLGFRKKQIRESENVGLLRKRRANKMASRRLKSAKKHLENNEKSEFYEEVSKALWGYMSDKLNIPRSQLSREQVREILAKGNVQEEDIVKFENIIDHCEFARFAPSENSQDMNEVYQKAIDAVSSVEEDLKS